MNYNNKKYDDIEAVEVEVEIVDDNSQTSDSGSKLNTDDKADGKSYGGIKPWIPLILAITYAAIPFDIIPDVPVVGWLEDGLLIAVAVLNGIEKSALANNLALQKIFKYIKWGLFIAGVLAITIIVLLVVVITKTVSS